MKIVFFEWSDFEDFIANKHKINFPKESKFVGDRFDIKLIDKDTTAISIKDFSHIDKSGLDMLKKIGIRKIFLRIAGFNMLDVDYAKSIGLKVYRVAEYSPESIAEFAMALILLLARKINVQRRYHTKGLNKRNLDLMGFLLRDKILGLHGYGRIARSLAQIAREGFRMKVLFYDAYFRDATIDERVNSLQELYSRSDIVSIHVPLTKETYKIVNRDLLNNIKENFMLINTARGMIVDKKDILELFERGKVKYLGFDVFGEDDKFDPRLLTDDSFQSYHSAFFTDTAVYQMLKQTSENIFGKARQENIL